MENIKLLLAHADRRVNNHVEVAVLDVCYDRAVVKSTRVSRLDEFVHQGSVWDYDLIVVGPDHLFEDRRQQAWAALEEVVKAIETIRAQHSTPIVGLSSGPQTDEALLAAGADTVVPMPLNSDHLKAELRALLDVNGFVQAEEPSRWSGLGSLLRGFQREKTSS